MAPTDTANSSTSLLIPTVDSQGSSRHHNAVGHSSHPPVPPSSPVRSVSVAAHTAPSSQTYNSASTSSRRQRASHNVMSPTSNLQPPERSQSHQDSSGPPYTDVYSHPAAVAYAAAHPRRTIPKFGPYLLLQTLGEGEFGKVKLGLHCQWGEEVAVKLIRRGNVDSSVRMSKIEREIEVLKMLKHPNIVRLYDVIETDKYIGIILEYASGGELFDHILAHRYLRERDAAKLFSQLISGVWYIHQKKIVHRDLKLENLLLDRNRNVIITDFGFANRFEHKADDLMQTSCGSPCYAAPELVISEGLYVGSAVDIWSCGVILYAMLAGYLPFDDDPANPDGDNINLLYKYIVSTPLSFPEYISIEARNLLSSMLVPDPTRRTTLDSVMRHPWLASYHGSRADGRPSAFGNTVDELESAAMDQHNLKRQAYQRQMRAAAAAVNAPVPPARTQSHRPEASAPATTSRSRSTQPEYLYESSADISSATSNVNATPTQSGVNKKVYGSPAALGLAEDDPFAGPTGSKTNNIIKPSTDAHGTTSAGLSPQQTHGHKSSSSTGGSFRHTIQVEYDDLPKSSRREEKKRERSGSETQSTAPKVGNPLPTTPVSISPPKERRVSQSTVKPLPPSPNTLQSSTRAPIPSGSKVSPPMVNDTRATNSRPVDVVVHQTASIGSTPAASASPSLSTSSDQQDRDSGSQKSTVSVKGGHRRGKSSLDRIGLGKIFGSGFGLGSSAPAIVPANGASSSTRNGSVTPVPSEGQTSVTSDHLSPSDKERNPEKKSRRNTLTVMVEPLSRSIRGKKARMATTPVTNGTNVVYEEKISRPSQPTSALLPPATKVAPVQNGAYSASQDTSGMQASSNKAKKVMQWFRTKSKGRDSVGFPIEEGATPAQSKYRQGFSASSSTINHSAASTAPGLTEGVMSPQVVVTSPNSARPTPTLLYNGGHPQRSASTATETALATPSFVTRFRNSITTSSLNQVQQAEKKSNPLGQLRIHHGAVDPTAVTTRPPPEVMAHVRKVLERMGIETQLESEYKYRCIRAKKKKGSGHLVATSSGNVSPSSHSGLGLAAVTMVGSAASNGVDRRGLPLPSPSAFSGTGGMLRGLLMRRQSSQSNRAYISSPPSLAFDDETSVIVSDPFASSDIVYGDPNQDAGDEVRFSVELTRIDRLSDTYSLDIRRLKGNLRSYKFLYDTLRERTDLSATQV